MVALEWKETVPYLTAQMLYVLICLKLLREMIKVASPISLMSLTNLFLFLKDESGGGSVPNHTVLVCCCAVSFIFCLMAVIALACQCWYKKTSQGALVISLQAAVRYAQPVSTVYLGLRKANNFVRICKQGNCRGCSPENSFKLEFTLI